MKNNKPGFSIERVCTMAMFNLTFLSMACMMCACLFLFHTASDNMMLAITYGVFTLFAGVYACCQVFTFRSLISNHVDQRIETKVAEIMAQTNISDRLKTKVDQVVTDRIERSDVIRLEEVPTPEIVHPNKSVTA